jgi:acylphosphatase
MIARKVVFSGRVQGVGFRYGTKQVAMGFDVTGLVRNLADGRVELCVMGEMDEVQEFLREIREESNLAHHILEYVEEEIPLAEIQQVRGFSIAG